MRIEQPDKKGDEWPNLASLEYPKSRRHAARQIAIIFGTWALVFALAWAFYTLLVLMVG